MVSAEIQRRFAVRLTFDPLSANLEMNQPRVLRFGRLRKARTSETVRPHGGARMVGLRTMTARPEPVVSLPLESPQHVTPCDRERT